MMKRILLAAALVVGSCGMASAVPSSSSSAVDVTASSELLQTVRDRRHRGNAHRHHGRRHHGRHYGGHRSYRGWHRYNTRPYGRRGCVRAGPVWLCP